MRRSLLFAVLLLLLAVPMHAQFILNGGFEDSTITANDTVPANWSVEYFGFAFTSDAHSGNKAATIWNWYSYAKGWISYGAAVDPYNGGGMPISINPDKLTGYFKYIYGNNSFANDSAICEILIYSHQNFTGARDTIAHITYHFGPQAEYAPFEIPITYRMPGLQADSILVRFISSESGFCNPTNECLYLYLDDVEVSTATGIHQSLQALASPSIYPSPALNGFQIGSLSPSQYPASIELTDLRGQLVFAAQVLGPSQYSFGEQLPAGSYLWRLKTRDGAQQTGRWIAQ